MWKQQYQPADWRTLQLAPFWVFAAVAGADGKIDKNETAMFVTLLSQWPQFNEPLMQEVLLSIVQGGSALPSEFLADKRGVVGGLGQAADVLDRSTTPEQAQAFKTALVAIGHKIADSSGGGIFGFGQKVSKEETAALVVIMAALRLKL